MKFIVANWKMNLGVRESMALARSVLRSVRGQEETPEIIICPAFTALAEVHKVIARSKIKLGAQDSGPKKSGAFTGEISPVMLRDVGCSYAIIGHSERRALGETNEIIAEKLQSALENGLTPILCVGESIEIRRSGTAKEFVENQLKIAFENIQASRKHKIFISYEPVWAIGSGDNAKIEDVLEMHALIENFILSQGISREQLTILYGGSVSAENVHNYLREKTVDGVLVGGASLRLREFKKILEAAKEVIIAQA